MLDRRILTFLTLYDTMSYHEAARRLSLTQPAVTQQIHSLEAEYGQKLFLYDHRRLRRTEAADTLALYARGMARSDRLLREAMAESAEHPHLRIGATKTIGDFVLTDAVTQYLSVPERQLKLIVDNTRNLLRLLEQDEIDFAAVEGDFDKRRYGSRLLRMEPFVGICAQDHPFAGRLVPPEELVRQTLFLREPGSGTRSVAERMLLGLGCPPEQFDRVVCVNSFGLLCRLTAHGSGVSFVYRSVAENESSLATFTVTGEPVLHAFHYVFLRDCGAEALIDSFGPI